MTTELLVTHFGYVGLFTISLLAASILPLSSELVVVLMPTLGYNVWLVGLVATLGNCAGAWTMYYMGARGGEFILARYVTLEEDEIARAQRWFGRWGAPILLFSWFPIIGDPLCAVAGMLHMRSLTFTAWTLVGKGWRYAVLLGALEWLLP